MEQTDHTSQIERRVQAIFVSPADFCDFFSPAAAAPGSLSCCGNCRYGHFPPDAPANKAGFCLCKNTDSPHHSPTK